MARMLLGRVRKIIEELIEAHMADVEPVLDRSGRADEEPELGRSSQAGDKRPGR